MALYVMTITVSLGWEMFECATTTEYNKECPWALLNCMVPKFCDLCFSLFCDFKASSPALRAFAKKFLLILHN